MCTFHHAMQQCSSKECDEGSRQRPHRADSYLYFSSPRVIKDFEWIPNSMKPLKQKEDYDGRNRTIKMNKEHISSAIWIKRCFGFSAFIKLYHKTKLGIEESMQSNNTKMHENTNEKILTEKRFKKMASSRRTGKRLANSHQISFQNSNCKC